MENRRVQAEVKEAAQKTWDKHKGASYTKAWTKMNNTIYDILLRVKQSKLRNQSLSK